MTDPAAAQRRSISEQVEDYVAKTQPPDRWSHEARMDAYQYGAVGAAPTPAHRRSPLEHERDAGSTAAQSSCAGQMLAQQDAEYNRLTNALIERHAAQVADLSARLAEAERELRWRNTNTTAPDVKYAYAIGGGDGSVAPRGGGGGDGSVAPRGGGGGEGDHP
jgi:hypothetical protein